MGEIITLYAQLKAIYHDLNGYMNYVFENLDYQDYELKYIMCTRFPNWDHPTLEVGDVGYLNIKYVQEGVSQWYDGEKLNVYKNTHVIFLKFVKELPKNEGTFIVD